jgi:hypothetical protein
MVATSAVPPPTDLDRFLQAWLLLRLQVNVGLPNLAARAILARGRIPR